MDNISFEYTEKLYEGITYPDLIILFNAGPEIVHERLLQRKSLTRYEKEKIGVEQQVINESIEYLERKGIAVLQVSTECTLKESISNTYNVIKNMLHKI